jgi:putative oxidoreductase
MRSIENLYADRNTFMLSLCMSRTPSSDLGLLVLRVGYASLLFGLHGGPRLLRAYHYFASGQPWGFIGVVEGIGLPFPLFFALASTAAEAICSLLVGSGIAMRLAATVIACNMAVALYSEASKGDPIDLPAMYLLVAVSLAIAGSGSWTAPRLWQQWPLVIGRGSDTPHEDPIGAVNTFH